MCPSHPVTCVGPADLRRRQRRVGIVTPIRPYYQLRGRRSDLPCQLLLLFIIQSLVSMKYDALMAATMVEEVTAARAAACEA